MTPLEREAKKRAEFVAALREIADLVETNTSVPVPYSSALQAGLPGIVLDENDKIRDTTEAERFAAVRRGAAALGLDVIEDSQRKRRATRMFGPIEFKLYAEPGPAPATTSSQRVVPADEDAALIGGAA